MDEVAAAMKVVDDLEAHEKNVIAEAYAEPEPQSFPVRNDPVGRMLDGYDYILNNPPGFAVSVALEHAKEVGIATRF